MASTKNANYLAGGACARASVLWRRRAKSRRIAQHDGWTPFLPAPLVAGDDIWRSTKRRREKYTPGRCLASGACPSCGFDEHAGRALPLRRDMILRSFQFADGLRVRRDEGAAVK